MSTVELEAAPRALLGKKVRFLRRDGWTPANIYGHNVESTPIQVRERDFERVVVHTAGVTLVALNGLGRAPQTVMVKRINRVATTGRLEHIDFYHVEARVLLHVEVPLHFVGSSEAVAKQDGMLLHALMHVRVESLPGDIPSSLEVDLSVLVDFEQSIHVKDIVMPSGATILNDPDELVAKVLAPRVGADASAAEAATAPTASSES